MNFFFFFYNLVTAFFEKKGGLNFLPLKWGRLIEDLQYSTLYFLIGF